MFAAVAAVYAWNLGGAPAAVSGDEALFAIHGKAIADTGCDRNGDCWPVLVQIEPGQSDRRFYQPLLFYAEAATFSVFPVSAATARLPLLVCGLINIALMYFVGLALAADRRAALAGALVLASSPAHFFYSRQATDYMLPVPFVLAWMLCLAHAMRRPSLALCAGMGLALGIGTFSYIAAWLVMPALLAVTLVVMAFWYPGKRWPAVLTTAITYKLVMLPAVIWLLRHPETLDGVLRHYEIASGASAIGGISRWLHYYRVLDLVSYVWASFNPVHLFFIGSPDLLNGTRAGGLFLLPAVVLLIVGAAEIVARKNWQWIFVAGVLLGVAPAVLNSTPAAVQRELAMLPFAAAIAALGYARLALVRSPLARIATAAAIVIALGQFLFFHHDYFQNYRYSSAGRYDPLNVQALFRTVARLNAERSAPEIILTIGDRSLGAGAGAEAYWEFYALNDDAIADKSRFEPVFTAQAAPLQPGTLIVVSTLHAALPGALSRARPVAVSPTRTDDPPLTIWRVE